MIELKRITKPDDYLLDELLVLYTETFPPEERRNLQQLKNFIESRPQMYFNAIEETGELCGLVIYWDFGSFCYLEHLAVFPEKRNRKIGQQVLEFMSRNIKTDHLLEVEPALDELTIRRINYYRRNGYEILDKNYIQSAYSGNKEDEIPLWIMGSPEINPDKLDEYIRVIRKEVYGV